MLLRSLRYSNAAVRRAQNLFEDATSLLLVGSLRSQAQKPSSMKGTINMALSNVCRMGGMATLVAVLAAAPTVAWADDAADILKAMSQYLANQENLSLSFDSDVEVITPEVQKIQFASSSQLVMSRPDKIHARRTGGYADVEIVFDGKTVTVSGKNVKVTGYVQLDAAGSVDQLVDRLRDAYGIEIPGADLLASNAYEVLTSDVISGAHIGRGVIDGVECEHLAFRGRDTDWQIWVQVGDRPLPRKYVITSKAVAGAPEYTVIIKEWKTDERPNANDFVFTPPAGVEKLDLKALHSWDEIPPETQAMAKGDQK
jgi:hypothetical protein